MSNKAIFSGIINLRLFTIITLPVASFAPLAAAPANDNFNNATVITGSSAEQAVNVSAATREPLEPDPWDESYNSVWYRWTAPSSGPVFIHSFDPDSWDSSFIGFGVYTGSTVSSLNQIGSDPYADPGNSTEPLNQWWRFDAVAGTTYHIAAWEYPWEDWSTATTGRIVLHQDPAGIPPSNDHFASATSFPTILPATINGHNFGATDESAAGETEVSSDYLYSWGFLPNVWYRWTPDYSGFAELEASNASCPLEINIGSGGSLQSLAGITSNASAGPGGHTFLRWQCTSGTTYRIRVGPGGIASDSGLFTRFRLDLRRLTPAAGVRSLVTEARTKLATRSAGCIATADALLKQALAIDSSDAEANLLEALTRFAVLGESPAFKTLIATVINDTSLSFDPFASHITLPKDLDGYPILPSTSDPAAVVTWLKNQLLPELAAIRTQLGLVPSGFTSSLSGAETGLSHLEIDHADVKALLATTHALEMMVHLLTTYNMSVPLQTLVSWDKTGQMSADRVRATYVNLLRFSTTDRRLQFRQQFTQVRLATETALAFARNQRVQQDFHLWDTNKVTLLEENDAITKGNLVENSFNGSTVTLGKEQVNLSHFVQTTKSLRDWLPGLTRGKVVRNSLPDPTLAGTFPAMTHARANSLLAKLAPVIDLSSFSAFAGEFLDTLSPANQAADADPDHDFRSNKQEYTFGGDPATPDQARQMVTIVETTGSNVSKLRVSFSRRRDLSDVIYRVAVSDDLQNWDRSGATVEQVGAPVPNDDRLTETVEFAIHGLAGNRPPRFVRLEATITP